MTTPSPDVLDDLIARLKAENARLKAELAEVETDRERWKKSHGMFADKFVFSHELAMSLNGQLTEANNELSRLKPLHEAFEIIRSALRQEASHG